jgi:electron transfer flavoprotein beta subunit
MLAALWNRPQATFASKLDLNGTVATVTREVDAGLEVIEVDLPAVVTTDLRLNEPRYVKLPDIMKAKKKAIEIVPIESLGVDVTPVLHVIQYDTPPPRSKGGMVKGVDELVSALRDRGLLA